jgi:FixJ family two-component response regulator
MRQGAEDFLTKRAPKEELLDAVKRALARDAQAREQRARLRDLRARFDLLTPREREVLAHVISGQLSKQIAYDLGTTERTIKAHRGNIMAKLGLQSVAELVRLAEALDIAPAGSGIVSKK